MLTKSIYIAFYVTMHVYVRVQLSKHYVFCFSFIQVGLWIDAGSRFETEKNNGVAHFLEHMAFKVCLSFHLFNLLFFI